MRLKIRSRLFALAASVLLLACHHAPSTGPRPDGDVATGDTAAEVGGDEAGDGDGPQSSADGPEPSAGCGSAAPQALAQYVTYSIHATGVTLDPTFQAGSYTRDYAVWLPSGYDSSLPHRTIFIASGCGSAAMSETRYMAADANGDHGNIYVGLASPPTSVNAGGCPDNTGARSTEWEFFALASAAVERAFCVDKNQEVIAGTASGSTLANMIGCYFSGVDHTRAFRPDLTLRAQFSVAGAAPVGLPPCGGPVAAFFMHDTQEFVPVTDSLMSRDRVLATNGCAATPADDWGVGILAGIGCKKYSACPPAYPVIFCETLNKGMKANYYPLVAPALEQFLMELPTTP